MSFNDAMTAHRKQRNINGHDRFANAGGDADSINNAATNYSLIERIERALLLLAYFIELDGDVHLPMYEKFESELQDLKKTEDARSRARRLLMAYSQTGGAKSLSLPDLIIDPGKSSAPAAP